MSADGDYFGKEAEMKRPCSSLWWCLQQQDSDSPLQNAEDSIYLSQGDMEVLRCDEDHKNVYFMNLLVHICFV